MLLVELSVRKTKNELSLIQALEQTSVSEKNLKLSPARWKSLIQNQKVYLGLKPETRFDFILKTPCKLIFELGAEDLPKDFKKTSLDIVYEDSDFLAINKDSGLPSQASLRYYENHLFSAVRLFLQNKNNSASLPYLVLLHRLDMDTSGLILLSKKPRFTQAMARVFEKRAIKKTYLALCPRLNTAPKAWGVFGNIYKAPQADHKFYFKLGSSSKSQEGRLSKTNFKILKSTSKESLIEARPITGRSHQIRVHLKDSHSPIFGDVFYQGDMSHPRLMLHASGLEFVHPLSLKKIKLTSKFSALNDWGG